MKRWVTAVAVLTIVIATTTAVVFALTGDSEPDRDTSEVPPASSDEVDGDYVDDIDPSDCDPVPLRSDCDIDPDECNLIHNINACEGHYEVTVNFNTTVTQEDIEEAEALLRTYDSDVDFIIMEIFPPIGRALLESESDPCSAITAQLESESYVESVACGPALPNDITDADLDAPVQQTNDTEE